MKRELAIIGYGRFGRFAAHLLKKDFNVYVVETERNTKVEAGIKKTSLEDASEKKFIILAVPINRLRNVLISMAPFVNEGALICDVCSVKEQPIQWMRQLLPGYVSILGTHPLFGPDSAAKNVRGKTVVLCPARVSETKLKRILRYLGKNELVVHITSPQKHDELMAKTLFLTQLVGRAVNGLKLPSVQIATDNFKLLRSIAETTTRDTTELFSDLYTYNRHARAIPSQLLAQFKKLSRILSQNR